MNDIRNNYALANFFTVRNTTPGTGIAGHAAPSTADNTKPVLYLFNASQNTRLYIEYVKVRMTAIGAGATTTDVQVFVDRAGAATRTSGGTQVTPVWNNSVLQSGAVQVSAVTAFIGAVVTSPVAAKTVASQRIRSVVPVVEDQYHLNFSAIDAPFVASLASTGTAVYQASIPIPPVIVGPLDVFELVFWGASQSGAHSFDIEAGWFER